MQQIVTFIPRWLSWFLDAPLDQVYLVLGLILSTLIGFLYPAIQDPSLRRSFAFLVGIPLIYYVYGYEGLSNLFSFSLFIYAVLCLLPRHLAGFGVCISAMGYISVSHIYRFFYDYGGWTMDTSVMLMYAVIKSTMLGFAYTDGGKEQESDQFKALTPYQVAHRVVELPSLYNYLTFMFFFSNAVLGPANEYTDLMNLIEQKQQFAQLPPTLLPTCKKLAIAAVAIFITVEIMPHFPSFYAAEPEFGEKSMFYKVWYFFMAFTLIRIRYYAGWQLADASVRASGASYRGNDEWDLCENANVWKIETGQNEKLIKAYWNRSTAIWLKEYIYQRVIMHKQLTGKEYLSPVFITSMVAAFWHGFYPTYYFSFFLAAQLTDVTRQFYRRRHHFAFLPSKLAYFLAWFASWFVCNFMGTAFTLLKVEMFWQYLCNLRFFPLILLFGSQLTIPLLPLQKQKK